MLDSVCEGVHFGGDCLHDLVAGLPLSVLAIDDGSDLVIKFLEFVNEVRLVVLIGLSVVEFNGCLHNQTSYLTE